MRMRKTARSVVVVTTAVVVVDSEVVMTAADLPRAVMAPEAADSAKVLVVDSARVAKAALRAVTAMTAVALRVVLEIATVIVAARRSVSGWRSRRMCR